MNNLLNKMKDHKAITIIIAVIILALATTGIVYAVTANKSTEPEPIPEVVEEEKEEYISTISVDLTGVDAKDIAIPAEVEIVLDAKAEVLDNESLSVTDTVLKLDELNDIAELSEGDYQLHMLATPIEVNGSTYKLPETVIDFTVAKDNASTTADSAIAENEAGFLVTYDTNTVLITIVLERIDVEDMTKEQLEAVAERIETEKPGEYTNLIEDLNKRAEEAVSDPESATDVEVPSESEGASPVTPTPTPTNPTNGNNGGGNSGNTGSNNGGSNNTGNTGGNTPAPTQPEKPSHTHSWTPVTKNHPAVAAQGYNENVPAQGYNETVPAQGYNQTVFKCSDGTTFTDSKEAQRYAAQNGLSIQTFSQWVETSPATTRWVETAPATTRWVETSPAKPAWTETIGHTCSCGATK